MQAIAHDICQKPGAFHFPLHLLPADLIDYIFTIAEPNLFYMLAILRQVCRTLWKKIPHRVLVHLAEIGASFAGDLRVLKHIYATTGIKYPARCRAAAEMTDQLETWTYLVNYLQVVKFSAQESCATLANTKSFRIMITILRTEKPLDGKPVLEEILDTFISDDNHLIDGIWDIFARHNRCPSVAVLEKLFSMDPDRAAAFVAWQVFDKLTDEEFVRLILSPSVPMEHATRLWNRRRRPISMDLANVYHLVNAIKSRIKLSSDDLDVQTSWPILCEITHSHFMLWGDIRVTARVLLNRFEWIESPLWMKTNQTSARAAISEMYLSSSQEERPKLLHKVVRATLSVKSEVGYVWLESVSTVLDAGQICVQPSRENLFDGPIEWSCNARDIRILSRLSGVCPFILIRERDIPMDGDDVWETCVELCNSFGCKHELFAMLRASDYDQSGGRQTFLSAYHDTVRVPDRNVWGFSCVGRDKSIFLYGWTNIPLDVPDLQHSFRAMQRRGIPRGYTRSMQRKKALQRMDPRLLSLLVRTEISIN